MFKEVEGFFIDNLGFKDIIKNEIEIIFPFLVEFIQTNESSLDLMIKNYVDFIRKCDGKSAVNTDNVSNSVKLIWKIHLLHPKMYHSDMKRIFNGRVVVPEKLGFNVTRIRVNTDQTNVGESHSGSFTSLNIKKSILAQTEFMKKIIQLNRHTGINIEKKY